MKRILLAATATLLLASPLACDIEKTGNQIASTKVMVGTLLSTPTVSISPAAFAGLDAGLPDGGTVDQPITVAGRTGAFVFFGTRESGSSGAPEPISNATVRLQTIDGGTVDIPGDGAGIYTRANSDKEGELKYTSGATYRFIATVDGESFVGQVDNAPTLEKIDEFHPPQGYLQRPAGQSLTFTRDPPPSGQERTIGFVTVFPLSSNGEKGEPTYSNAPTTPLDFLYLVALPLEWKKEQITIPGTAFPEAGKTYLVAFQSVRSGGAESDNLFLGSALLVGTADVGVVRTE